MATVLLFFTRVLPVIQMLVHLAEEFHPAPGSGAQKFELVLNAILGIAKTIPVLAQQLDAVKDAAKPAIETAVSALNDLKDAREQLLTPQKAVGSQDPAEITHG